MTRQNQCQCCGNYGHNRRSCPRIKETYQRMEDLAKKYNIEITEQEREHRSAAPWQRLQATIETAGKWDEDNYSYRDRWIWEEHQNRTNNLKATKKIGGRKCRFCTERGHNSRTCETKKEHVKKCGAVRALAHRVVRVSLEQAGLVPGALMSYRDYNYQTGNYETNFGIVTGIDWDEIAKQELDNKDGCNRNIENWYTNATYIRVRKHNGGQTWAAFPRDLPQQTSYHYDAAPSDARPKMVSPVIGGKISKDGYLGDTVTLLPPELRIFRWGKQLMDEEWADEVNQLLDEVGTKWADM